MCKSENLKRAPSSILERCELSEISVIQAHSQNSGVHECTTLLRTIERLASRVLLYFPGCTTAMSDTDAERQVPSSSS
jgi:hypothetical protein